MKITPKGAMARNHCIQLISTLLVFLTSSTASGLGARPVRNRVLVIYVAEIAIHIR